MGRGPHPETATMTKAKLTDLQLVLLSAAAARPDFMLLPPPDGVRAKGRTLERALARLLAAGLVAEVTARHDAETWRETEDGRRFGLRIAPAGLEAIGLSPAAAEEADEAPAPASATSEAGADPAPASPDPTTAEAAADPAPAAVEPAERSEPAGPLLRPGTKQARLAEMISAPGGAGIDALSEALGWQVHTTRAALTGLRRKGLAVESAKDAGGRTVYRLGPVEAAADAA